MLSRRRMRSREWQRPIGRHPCPSSILQTYQMIIKKEKKISPFHSILILEFRVLIRTAAAAECWWTYWLRLSPGDLLSCMALMEMRAIVRDELLAKMVDRAMLVREIHDALLAIPWQTKVIRIWILQVQTLTILDSRYTGRKNSVYLCCLT